LYFTNLILLKENSYHSLVDWSFDEANNLNQQFEKSYILSYLTHILGDIHQPLHACALINNAHPSGDMGGNLFRIKYKTMRNLHSFWDSVLDKVKDGLKMPLDSDGLKLLDSYTENIMNEYTRESLEEKMENDYRFKDWIMESWEHCRDFVYKKIEDGGEPSKEYIEEGFKIAKERLALAGYRLSNVLSQSYYYYLKAFEHGPSKLMTMDAPQSEVNTEMTKFLNNEA